MLPYIVIFMGILYLVLHYSGALQEIGGNAEREREQEASRKLPGKLDREIEQRLKVFEDFLKQDEPPQDDN